MLVRVVALVGLLACASFVLIVPSPSFAEFGVGHEGDFKNATKKASAMLNDALSSFHLMMSALDRDNVGTAYDLRKRTVAQLDEAAGAYKNSVQYAGDRELRPLVRTLEEQSQVAYFYAHAEAYGIKAPMTEKTVIAVVPNILLAFEHSIGQADLQPIAADTAARQAFLRAALNMQEFLNSVTTLFAIG